jgi:hypothetical protein
MNYQEKYLKYKTKYLNLKKLIGGGDGPNSNPSLDDPVMRIMKTDGSGSIKITNINVLRLQTHFNASNMASTWQNIKNALARAESILVEQGQFNFLENLLKQHKIPYTKY